jgi:hypothetical protein
MLGILLTRCGILIESRQEFVLIQVLSESLVCLLPTGLRLFRESNDQQGLSSKVNY